MSFKDISAASIIIPIAVGIMQFKPASRLERSVLLFLCFGFLVDASMQLHYSVDTREKVVAAYSLAECLFFYFMLFELFEMQNFKKTIKLLGVVFFILWFCSFYMFAHVNYFFDLSAKLFDMLYYMVISFLSSFLLLKMIEKNNPYITSSFWFVLALFTYCFTTFFIAAFIRDDLAEKVWWLHDVMNIIAYLLFTKAFLSIKKQTPHNT